MYDCLLFCCNVVMSYFLHSPSLYFGKDVSKEKLKMYHPDFIRYLRNRWANYLQSRWTEWKLTFQIVGNEIIREAEAETRVSCGENLPHSNRKQKTTMTSICVGACTTFTSSVFTFTQTNHRCPWKHWRYRCTCFVSDSSDQMLWKPNTRTFTVHQQVLWCCWQRCTPATR